MRHAGNKVQVDSTVQPETRGPLELSPPLPVIGEGGSFGGTDGGRKPYAYMCGGRECCHPLEGNFHTFYMMDGAVAVDTTDATVR